MQKHYVLGLRAEELVENIKSNLWQSWTNLIH